MCASAHACQGHSTPRMGLTYVYSCVHTEVYVCHHDRGWVPTPNVCWRMVRDALAHAVWPRGHLSLALRVNLEIWFDIYATDRKIEAPHM